MFRNRERELQALEAWWSRSGATMGLLWGRRRVGKTAILERFAASKRTVFHVASNRPRADELRTLSTAATPLLGGGLRDLRDRPFVDWVDAIETLATAAVDEPLLLVLDEYPELTRGDQTLDSTLRAVWERVRGRSSLRILLCGSATRTMQALQAERAPLYGRMDLRLLVHPFAPHEAGLLLPGLPAAEQALVWGITDGVPLYLSWWDTDADVGTNLTRLVLDPSGLLRAEGDLVLATEGLATEAAGRDYLPGQVLRALAAGQTTYSELKQAVRAEPARTLDALQSLRLVERLTPVTDPQASRRRRYRITDNFLAFFLGVVERHRSEIDRGLGEVLLPTLSAELDEHMGARWEHALRVHLRRMAAGGELGDVVAVGSFWRLGEDPAELDAVVLAGRQREAVLVGEAKWARRIDARRLTRALARKAEALPARAEDLRLAVLAREEVTEAGDALALTAADVFTPDR